MIVKVIHIISNKTNFHLHNSRISAINLNVVKKTKSQKFSTASFSLCPMKMSLRDGFDFYDFDFVCQRFLNGVKSAMKKSGTIYMS